MGRKRDTISSQKELWNKKHVAGEHVAWQDNPNSLAREVIKELAPGAKLLELGCGIGGDARFFARQAIEVIATDISDVVIAQNRAIKSAGKLRFDVLDIGKTLPYRDHSFDAVYAHLSLHYFVDDKTRKVFQEIARILRPQGRLYFSCRSPKDPMYGEGKLIEGDVFLRKQHIRHFFSKTYVMEVLKPDFSIIRLDEEDMVYTNRTSVCVICSAFKKA